MEATLSDGFAVIGTCPACGARLQVARLQCPQCRTAIEGRFELCPFCAMTGEQREFARLFIAVRGNLREMERILGLSYPAVRARLESVIEALGYPSGGAVAPEAQPEPGAASGSMGEPAPGSMPVSSARRRAVLEALERGEITPEQAIARLRETSR